MESVFAGIEPKHAALWGRHTVKLRHHLAGSELFSDAGLAQLIEAVPAKTLTITTMAADAHDLDSWRHVDRAGLSGEQLLAAVHAGRIWIQLSGINEVDPRFSALLARAYDELHAAIPGFRTFKQRLGLLVSSPGAQVFYHADKPGQGLWQIRGKKRIWVYPAAEPFLQPVDLEKVMRGLIEEDIPYEPWFDEYAEVIDLAPGDMLHWALNGPHRVKNHDCVNVSLTTEHWTDDIRRNYAMNFANGVLRREFGWRPRSRSINGPSFWPKAALALAWRLSGMQDRQRYKRQVALKVDPRAPDAVAELPPSRKGA
jgi:hypothetical protein